MESTDRTRGLERGSTGTAIGSHVRAARERLGLDLAGLAERLTVAEWPIAKSALSRLENGQRRVDVDDLMALSVVLHVSPLQLLLGEFDATVTPTTVIEGLVPDEIWAWASGDVDLEPAALAAWWRNEIQVALAHIEGMQSLRDGPSSLPPAAQERTRRWVEGEIRDAQARHELAVKRIASLTGSGEIAGAMHDSLPQDPTTTVIFPSEGQAGE